MRYGGGASDREIEQRGGRTRFVVKNPPSVERHLFWGTLAVMNRSPSMPEHKKLRSTVMHMVLVQDSFQRAYVIYFSEKKVIKAADMGS